MCSVFVSVCVLNILLRMFVWCVVCGVFDLFAPFLFCCSSSSCCCCWCNCNCLLLFGWNFAAVCAVCHILGIFVVTSVWVLGAQWTRRPGAWQAWWPSVVNNFAEQVEATGGGAELLQTKKSGQHESNLGDDQSFECQEDQTADEQWNQGNQFSTESQQQWASDFLQFATSFFDGAGNFLCWFLWEFEFHGVRVEECGEWIDGHIVQAVATFRWFSWQWFDYFIFRNSFAAASWYSWISAFGFDVKNKPHNAHGRVKCRKNKWKIEDNYLMDVQRRTNGKCILNERKSLWIFFLWVVCACSSSWRWKQIWCNSHWRIVVNENLFLFIECNFVLLLPARKFIASAVWTMNRVNWRIISCDAIYLERKCNDNK